MTYRPTEHAEHAAPRRRGLSIMEVLFAIGVLTIGLLGLASVLPVAVDNASSALQRDKMIEQVQNQIATEVARMGDRMDSVVIANNSADWFDGHAVWNDERFLQFDQSEMPDAFCIDPWFLTATSNLRPDENATPNAYDRTKFPCYSAAPVFPSNTKTFDTFDPRLSPADAIASSSFPQARFERITLPPPGTTSTPSFQSSQRSAREVDNLALFQPEDTSRAPGLFVQDSASGAASHFQATGHYSSMVLMSRNAPGSNVFDTAIVTTRDRNVLINPGGGSLAFQLAPFTAATADQENKFDNERTYEDEVIGYVTNAPRMFLGGGGGEFTFQHSAYMSPNVSDGDWLMLARQSYSTGSPGPSSTPEVLKFNWYQVRAVVKEPTLISGGGVYETTVSVRGPDWMFHPTQSFTTNLGYASPYEGPGGFQPTSPNPPEYDFSTMGDELYGTIVVLMPSVVGVHQQQVTL